MANSADRARFFLEQSVPELQELLRKDVFTKDEISAITKRRSDFEHIVNARGGVVADYIRYAAYEQNLESLKKKRLQRLGIKKFSHGGQRRIFFIFERATRKFPGDVQLWMQYLDYARSLKAHKRVGKILTAVLRLHPTNPDLWSIAAKYAMETEGELNAARSHLQRGLRFCPKDKPLWLEYCQLEMIYISKTSQHLHVLDENPQVNINRNQPDPAGTSEQVGQPQDQVLEPADKVALSRVAASPALSGAIPIAIFDSAMKEFDNDPVLAEQYFDLVSKFHQLACCQTILKHIIGVLQSQTPSTSQWAICSFKLPLVGIETTSSKFPMALRHGLQMLRAAMAQQRRADTKYETASMAIDRLLPLVIDESMDSDVKKVIKTVLKQMTQIIGSDRAAERITYMHRDRREIEARSLLKLALKIDAESTALQSVYSQLQQPD